jgi:TatD DNase family protein
MPIFDTHAHYDSSAFNADRDEVISSLPDAGVALVVDPGCDVESSRAAVALAEKYPHVYAAVGLHPEDCAGAGEAEFAAIRALCGHEKVVAIGEIGLDYYWAENPPREFQQAVFRRQLELAIELDLPVIIHDREAHGDSLAIVLEYPQVRGVFHCFSGSPEMAQELLKRGWYLGFDGPITYKNAKRAPEVSAITPLDRIVVETDSPYLTPVPYRGKRNDSTKLPYVLEKLAEWKGVSIDEMTRVTWENGLRLFGLEGKL